MENGVIEKKKYSGFIIWLIILSLLVVGLGGYIVYDKLLSQSNNIVKNNNDDNENNGEINKDNQAPAQTKTVLICKTDLAETEKLTLSSVTKIEFLNNIFITYEQTDTIKYKNIADYNDAKFNYPDYEVPDKEFDEKDLTVKLFYGTVYGTPSGLDEKFRGKTLEQIKEYMETASDVNIKKVCSIEN